MTRKELIEKLEKMGACDDGIDWVLNTEGTPEELWHKADPEYKDWLCDALELRGETYKAQLSLLQEGFERELKPLSVAYWAQSEILEDRAKRKPLDEAYDAQRQPLYQRYGVLWAKMIDANVSWSDVEKALQVRKWASFTSLRWSR